MRKIFFLLTLVSLLLVTSSIVRTSFAQTTLTGEHIQNFDTAIIINKDGTIDVKETIVYDFDGLSRHGIYRDIPYVKTNKESKKLQMDFSDISVTDETGNNYQFSKIWEDQTLRLKIGDPDRTISGVHTYVISYRVAGALTYFSDHDELYWNVTGNDWTVPINSSTPGVELPVGIAQNEITAICYTGVQGSIQQLCSVNKENRLVHFTTKTFLGIGEGLTVVVGFPKNIVAVLEPKPYVTFWETVFGKILIALFFLAGIFWYIVYPIWIPIKWLRQGRDPKPVGTGEARAWFEPPKSTSGRPLTPAEVGGLVDEKADMADISALIVSLAQKGFLKIVEDIHPERSRREKNEFSLLKTKELAGDTTLLPYERDFLHELFSQGDSISLKTRKTYLYNAVENVKKSLYEQLVSSGFFTHSPEKARTFYSVIGVLALTTFNIPLAFSAFLFGRHMPKKTVAGTEASNVAKSLKNFLTSQERQLKFQAEKQMLFEKLLPFAVAFGVEKIWADRFKDLRMRPPDWYEGYSGTRFSSVYFANSLNSAFSRFQTAATTPTSSSSGFSSGFSGGSSGGGGGGGGGGSW